MAASRAAPSYPSQALTPRDPTTQTPTLPWQGEYPTDIQGPQCSRTRDPMGQGLGAHGGAYATHPASAGTGG